MQVKKRRIPICKNIVEWMYNSVIGAQLTASTTKSVEYTSLNNNFCLFFLRDDPRHSSIHITRNAFPLFANFSIRFLLSTGVVLFALSYP